MPLDAQTDALIKQAAAATGPTLDSLAPPEARRVPVHDVQDARVRRKKSPRLRTGEFPTGERDSVRIYTPGGAGPFPLLGFYHGGWVM